MRATALVALAIVTMAVGAAAHADKTPAEVKAMLDAGGDLIVVDVREESEYCDSTRQPPGHIVGAINMPWNSGYLQAHYLELDPDRVTIVVCRSGGRSHSAATFLDGKGFTRVFDMLGGMNAWLWDTGNCWSAGVPGAGAGVPLSLALGEPAPNPFGSAAEIVFAIPAGRGPAQVTLAIYDSRGRLLSKLVDGRRGPGTHRSAWDGTDSSGRPVAAGTYFLRLTSDRESRTRKLIVAR
ncbi:MAG: rhodanese-like domain-containing protein [bacterium]